MEPKMAPHSKTCCAIPAHLHVIELLCFASIFKASRYMKMKWTKSGRAFFAVTDEDLCFWDLLTV